MVTLFFSFIVWYTIEFKRKCFFIALLKKIWKKSISQFKNKNNKKGKGKRKRKLNIHYRAFSSSDFVLFIFNYLGCQNVRGINIYIYIETEEIC